MSIIRRNTRGASTHAKAWFELKVKFRVRLELVVAAAAASVPVAIWILQR